MSIQIFDCYDDTFYLSPTMIRIYSSNKGKCNLVIHIAEADLGLSGYQKVRSEFRKVHVICKDIYDEDQVE